MGKKSYSTVEEILDDILKTLPQSFIEDAKTMTVDDFCIKQHFDLGMAIRNKYCYENKLYEQLVESLGILILQEDDFSHFILKQLYPQITTMKWGIQSMGKFRMKE